MTIIASLKNLNLSFGTKTIFNNAELTIHKGDHIGLIGLNGHGKSTLFKILSKEVIPDISTPPFIFDKNKEHFNLFLIPQELNIKDFKHLSIENYYLAFYPKLHKVFLELEKDYSNSELLQEFEDLKGWEIQNNYLSYLKAFELSDLNQSLDKLSGGEKRKMALSIGLSSESELLLWDEPTNHLDIETIEKFEDELMKSKKTFIIISHDRYLLNHTTDHILHIEHGEINHFKGKYLDYLEYLDNKEAELKKNLSKLENKQRRELAWMRQGIKARGTRSKKRVEGFHQIKEQISSIKSKSKKVVDLSLLHSGRQSKILVEIKNGCFAYNNKEIFNDINLIIAKKDKIALIGPNGAGKSTLIKVFSEKLALNSGLQKNANDLKIIVFDQERQSLDENKTPLEIIAEGNDYIIFEDGRKKHINSYLNDFLFTSDQVTRPISTLSGGEKNRLQLALFMKQSADIWVFDEPTNDLDIETIELLEKELKSYESAVIIIGHDRAFLDNVCRSTWLIHNKDIEVFEGGYEQVAPYLHAIEMEKGLKKTKPPSPDKSKNIQKTSKKDLIRLEDIEKEIEDIENRISNLNDQMSKFDFSQLQQSEYHKLIEEKEKLTEKNNILLSEWDELSSLL